MQMFDQKLLFFFFFNNKTLRSICTSVFIRAHVVLNLNDVFYWRSTKGKKSLHSFCQTGIFFEFIVTTTVKHFKGWGIKKKTLH